MASSAALYTPEMLALATSLAAYPLGEGMPLRGKARSPTCGSMIELGLAIDLQGRITGIGLRAQACAVGQAAAALFARGAVGRHREDISHAQLALEQWLHEGGPVPDWPGLQAIAAARDFPGRHGTIMLGWRAACEALPSD